MEGLEIGSVAGIEHGETDYKVGTLTTVPGPHIKLKSVFHGHLFIDG